MTQPPVYIYAVAAATRAYALVSPRIEAGRLFTWFINLPAIAASAATAVLIGMGVRARQGAARGRLAGLAYWLNPLVILNSPVQGYLDPLAALPAVASVLALSQRRVALSASLLAVAVLTKPQAVLLVPIAVAGALSWTSWRVTARGCALAALTTVAICAPFALTGHALGLVGCVVRLRGYTQDLSRQALNLWWPFQYLANAERYGVSTRGDDPAVFADLPVAEFAAAHGHGVAGVGLVLFLTLTALNVTTFRRRAEADPDALPAAAALQVLGYFAAATGVHCNHYALAIPLLHLVAFTRPALLTQLLVICAAFLAQDLIFYGFGRDLNPGRTLLTGAGLGWVTVPMALANVGLVVVMARTTLAAGEVRTTSCRECPGTPAGP